MPAARSGPFAWSSFGSGYLVASFDDGGSPVIDVVLPGAEDGSLCCAALPPAEAVRLATELTSLSGGPAGAAGPAELRMLPELGDRLADVDAALRAWDRSQPPSGSPAPGRDGGAEPPGAEAALNAVDDLLERLYVLRGDLADAVQSEPSATARLAAGRGDPETVMTGPRRSLAPDRRLTTMGGLALALGIVAVFWIAVGVLVWTLLR